MIRLGGVVYSLASHSVNSVKQNEPILAGAMIHDFATLPRVSRQSSVPAPAPAPRRRHGLLLVLLAVVLAGLAVWRVLDARSRPEPAFVPGETESREYQAAMETEAVEARQEARQRQTKRAVPVRATATTAPDPKAAALEARLKNAPTVEPQFGFYDSLSGSAWTVPVQRGIYVTEEERKRAGGRFLLQAASVRDLAEAQRLVQKLRSLGMEASIQAADPPNNDWYRVNVGPFDSVSRMNKAEDVLVSLRMMPLKRRLP